MVYRDVDIVEALIVDLPLKTHNGTIQIFFWNYIKIKIKIKKKRRKKERKKEKKKKKKGQQLHGSHKPTSTCYSSTPNNSDHSFALE